MWPGVGEKKKTVNVVSVLKHTFKTEGVVSLKALLRLY
jgi:hypothetical protein